MLQALNTSSLIHHGNILTGSPLYQDKLWLRIAESELPFLNQSHMRLELLQRQSRIEVSIFTWLCPVRKILTLVKLELYKSRLHQNIYSLYVALLLAVYIGNLYYTIVWTPTYCLKFVRDLVCTYGQLEQKIDHDVFFFKSHQAISNNDADLTAIIMVRRSWLECDKNVT